MSDNAGQRIEERGAAKLRRDQLVADATSYFIDNLAKLSLHLLSQSELLIVLGVEYIDALLFVLHTMEKRDHQLAREFNFQHSRDTSFREESMSAPELEMLVRQQVSGALEGAKVAAIAELLPAKRYTVSVQPRENLEDLQIADSVEHFSRETETRNALALLGIQA